MRSAAHVRPFAAAIGRMNGHNADIRESDVNDPKRSLTWAISL